jgi:hypothetical protein
VIAPVVYALANASMPGLVKIGRTGNLSRRVKKLSDATGVPTPFFCVWSSVAEADAHRVERRAHQLLEQFRVSAKREFFKISNDGASLAIIFACGVVATGDTTEAFSDFYASFIEEHGAEIGGAVQ